MQGELQLELAGCTPPVRKPEPTQAERRKIAASKKPVSRKKYGPADYAKSVPSEVRGQRSTKGVSIIHHGPNRAEKRAQASANRHTQYEPRSNRVTRLGDRAIQRRQLRDAQARNMERQRAALAAERKSRVAATKARNAAMAAVVAGLETDTATWK